MGCEDVEDDFAAVDDLRLGLFFDGLPLRRGQMVVEDDQVCPGIDDRLLELLKLAAAQAGGGVGVVAQLDHFADDFGPGGLDQPLDLVERPFFTALILESRTATRKARCSRTFSFSRLGSDNGRVTGCVRRVGIPERHGCRAEGSEAILTRWRFWSSRGELS